MTLIKQRDIVQSIAEALQFISYYHPLDFIHAVADAWEKEQSPAAKDALAQILINSKMCAEGKRPICQDTGTVVVFLKIGMQVQFDTNCDLIDIVNQGVRQAYLHPDNKLRASMMDPPYGKRENTKDNTPAIIHSEIVAGNKIEIALAAKGGGSENKTRFTILNPSDSIVDWIIKTLPGMGAGWCPPGMLGIGIGGTPEKAMIMAKESLMSDIDMPNIIKSGASNETEALRLEIYNKINDLGIGAQGLGGLTTVVDVKVKQYPTHAASLPVALVPNCAATRHIEFTLDGSGPAEFTPPDLNDWPDIASLDTSQSISVDLNTLDKTKIQTWKQGDQLLLSGTILTGRDAAHKRLQELLDSGKTLPDGVNLTNKFIYYVGPVDAVRDEVIGPAGPTTATRMDKFSDMMLGQTGLIGMIGKAERGAATIASIKQHKAVYLMAVGGAAYLVSKAIKHAKVIAFADMGMEAIYELEVKDMPVTVAVDSQGNAIHTTGPAEWKLNIEEMKKGLSKQNK